MQDCVYQQDAWDDEDVEEDKKSEDKPQGMQLVLC